MCATLLLFAITVSDYNNTAAFRPMNSGSLPSPVPVPSTTPSPVPVPSTTPSPVPVPSTTQKSTITLNFIDYSNSVLGIALQYPADWNIVSVKNGIQFVKEKDTSYVEIRVHDVKGDKIDLKQYAEGNIADRKKSREGFKLIIEIPTDITLNQRTRVVRTVKSSLAPKMEISGKRKFGAVSNPMTLDVLCNQFVKGLAGITIQPNLMSLRTSTTVNCLW